MSAPKQPTEDETPKYELPPTRIFHVTFSDSRPSIKVAAHVMSVNKRFPMVSFVDVTGFVVGRGPTTAVRRVLTGFTDIQDLGIADEVRSGKAN